MANGGRLVALATEMADKCRIVLSETGVVPQYAFRPIDGMEHARSEDMVDVEPVSYECNHLIIGKVFDWQGALGFASRQMADGDPETPAAVSTYFFDAGSGLRSLESAEQTLHDDESELAVDNSSFVYKSVRFRERDCKSGIHYVEQRSEKFRDLTCASRCDYDREGKLVEACVGLHFDGDPDAEDYLLVRLEKNVQKGLQIKEIVFCYEDEEGEDHEMPLSKTLNDIPISFSMNGNMFELNFNGYLFFKRLESQVDVGEEAQKIYSRMLA